MVTFQYKGQGEDGKIITGTMQATDELELHERLKRDNIKLMTAKELKDKKSAKKMKSNAVAEFARNIGKLISAGVTLVRALRIMSEDESIDPKNREIYQSILKLVRSGIPLSDALVEQGDAFPSLFINMIRSAENTGNMDQVALQMADYYDKDYRMRQKVKSSLTYPKILTVLLIAVVAVIFGFVMPQFSDLFASMDELPKSTMILMGISEFVKTKWYVLIFVAAVVYLVFRILMSIPKVKYLKDKMMVRMPLVGRLMKVIYTARFARTLASLYSAGISIINCLTIAQTTIDNLYIESQFNQVIADVRAGNNLSESLSKVDGFTKKLTSSVMVGEETGSMDSMLESIAEQLEYDSDIALNKLVSYLEPVMLVVMAVIVGFIMISVIQPIYGSYNQISNSY